MDIRVILILTAEALFALWLLYKAGLLKDRRYVFAAVLLTALAFAASPQLREAACSPPPDALPPPPHSLRRRGFDGVC